ncbi:protein FAM126B-like [Dioscorea cayenensis subsp. rotundata]|uniref:Protein FAM126B-like n=1 Tax=Dioscorea cayennensis subsp. rotundata TaxID=55577 RepID=A0AB40BNU0_DIOCR|nr:protein FAM126B-like [Dioscorea cayenensis subsp. rotundata]
MSNDDSSFPPSNPTTTQQRQCSQYDSVLQSLTQILGSPLPDSITLSDNPPFSLLHNHHITTQITNLLLSPSSGAGDDSLCRWLYDTFQSTCPDLQLLVLNFLPTLAGLYLSRSISRQPLAGFEAVLLALYAHETTSRANQPLTFTLPNLTYPSIYHESKSPAKNRPTEDPEVVVFSQAIEPHGTVRSTKRARIVGVALELYFSKIALMPLSSKLEFCRFCIAWSGFKEKEIEKEEEEKEEMGRRVPLPWELLQPILRILGHCLMGGGEHDRLKEMKVMANDAVNCIYERALHDMNPQAILASRSLLSLGKMEDEIMWETSSCLPTSTTTSYNETVAQVQDVEKNQPVNQD